MLPPTKVTLLLVTCRSAAVIQIFFPHGQSSVHAPSFPPRVPSLAPSAVVPLSAVFVSLAKLDKFRPSFPESGLFLETTLRRKFQIEAYPSKFLPV